MFRMLRNAAAAAALLTVAATANAATTFNFLFSVPWITGGTATGSGQLFANDNGSGGYTVTGAQGVTYAYSGAPARAVDDADLVGIIGSPTITGSAAAGYTINSLSLTGPQVAYTFVPNIFGSKYTVNGPAGASTNGTLSLALAASAAAAVPEPASWAMMISGFGMIGCAMRRKRAMPSVA